MGYIDTVKREINQLRHNRLGWFVSFILPFLLCFVVCLIFSNATPKNLPIAVWNADNSEISRMIVRNLNTLPSCKVKYQLTNYREGKTLLETGKIYGFVVIPKNFQKDIYMFKQPQLVFYYNNQRILIGGTISKDINLLVQSMLVGIDAKTRNKKGMPFDSAIKQANLINVVEHIRSNPYFNYQYFLSVTAFGHILQIFMIFTSVWAIGTEFKHGKTKEWLNKADNSIIVAVCAKLTPYFVNFSVVFAILYFIYYGIFQVPFVGNFFIVILGTFLFIIACFLLGALFMSINGNFRYCLSGATFYSAIGFALAGVTYPIMSMPLIIKIYAFTMPLHYWIQIMLDQSLRNIPIIYDFKFFVSLLCISFVAFLTLYRLKTLALDEKRWFQV